MCWCHSCCGEFPGISLEECRQFSDGALSVVASLRHFSLLAVVRGRSVLPLLCGLETCWLEQEKTLALACAAACADLTAGAVVGLDVLWDRL